MSMQDQSRAVQASPHDVIGVGIAFSAAGLYFMLGAAGYLPMPESHSPAFIVFCAGAAFLFAGLTCMVRARAGMTDAQTDIPDSAPRVDQAVVPHAGDRRGRRAGDDRHAGSRSAPGPRAFNLSAPLVEMQTTGELIGRSVFALGAVIAWIFVIALTVGTVRKLFDRRGG